MKETYNADDPALEQDSNKLLDAALEELDAELARNAWIRSYEQERSYLLSKQPGWEAMQPGWLERAMIIGRIAEDLIEGGGPLRNPELLQYLAGNLALDKRGRGERDPPVDRILFNDLWFEVDLLRQLWKQNNIQIIRVRTRGGGPKSVALDIVLRRHSKQNLKHKLEVYDKNRGRRRR